MFSFINFLSKKLFISDFDMKDFNTNYFENINDHLKTRNTYPGYYT